MDSAVLSIFVLLQILLAPILYPMGYVVQGIVVLLSCWRKRSIKEDDLSLLEALAMTGLLCNMVLDENITMAGYAARFGLLLFRLYQSNSLQDLGKQVVEPMTSIFLLVELLASPHLYPAGYLAQLALILFLSLSGTLQQMTFLRNRRQRRSSSSLRAGRKAVPVAASVVSAADRTGSRVGEEKEDAIKASVPSSQVKKRGVSSLFGALADNSSDSDDYDDEGNNGIMTCKICFEHPVTTAFLSCGHVCCKECSDALTSFSNLSDDHQNSNNSNSTIRCPFCKATVWRKLDIFFP